MTVMRRADLRFDTFHSGLRAPVTVRVTHLPTGHVEEVEAPTETEAKARAVSLLRERLRAQEGAAAVELALVTPLVLLVLMLVVAVGRQSHARIQVEETARDAARAASIARLAAAAGPAASAVARAQLEGCREVGVDTDLSHYRPGGSVAVVVRCVVYLSDLTGLGLPGRRTIEVRHVSPIDTYRGGP